MQSLFTNNKTFYIAALVYIVLGCILLLILPMGSIELSVYKLHTPVFNYFFLGTTYIGDGLALILILSIIWYFTNWQTMVVVGLTVLLTFCIIQPLKHYVFADADRPLRFFGEGVQQYIFDYMELNMHNSFPSGHSGQAMAIAASLSFFIRNKSLQFVLLFVAILVFWSRVYLMQHFFLDTLAGAIIGLLVAALVYFVVGKTKPELITPSP